MFNFIKKAENFYRPPMKPKSNLPKVPIEKSLELNLERLQKIYDNSSDLTVKRMNLKLSDGTVEIAIITMEGMVDKEILATSITNPISTYSEIAFSDSDIFTIVEKDIITNCDHLTVKYIDDVTSFIMSGFACVLIDGCEKGLAVGVQGYSFRSVSEPDTDVLQRGSREGFVEPIRVNISMVRRRLRNTKLKFETMNIGDISQTEICLCYLTDVVSDEILDEVKSRLEKVNIDTLLASGYLVSYLESDGSNTLFSGVGITERPDTACAKMCEGKVVILVDGTPSALIVPHIMVENFQTLDDYSERPYFATATRWLKYISFVISILLPGLYVALASFNPEFFPAQLLTKVATSIAKTPFSAFSEVLLFTFIYEIMREAGLRLPKTLGHAVSIIGGLVIGDTAVSSGFIGAPTLMIVALTVICSYVIPDLYASIAILRFLFIIFGGFWGLWGIFLLLCILTINICSKESFGVPFSSPFSPLSLFGLRDVLVRADWQTLSRRQVTVQDLKEG